MPYFPRVDHPLLPVNNTQMLSDAIQKPFFFGGSQILSSLGIEGRGMVSSMNHSAVHHQGGKHVKIFR